MSIGEVLAQARHRRGLTVAEVSHYTRVRESIIRSIERDDFLLPGSDGQIRDQIRSLASTLGVDPGPLIAEFDANYRSAPEPTGAEAVRSTGPFHIRRLRRRRRIRWLPVLAVLVLAAIGGAAYYVVSGRAPFAGAPSAGAPSSGTPSAGTRSSGASSSGVPSAGASSAGASSAGASAPGRAGSGSGGVPLVPVRVLAFGPGGPADGDNPQTAPLAVDHKPATAWTTGWYGTPRFPTVQQGTGLLLDMGHVVTLTAAEVTLGSAPGASFQMRVGDTPTLADLPEVAVATNASGPLGVRFTVALHARYVLIWFTALPPVGSGTYQASVYNVTLLGASKSR
ncbi:MAG: helix-turn-helix domain-containing protein [Streptosporangiaceae bacterium]